MDSRDEEHPALAQFKGWQSSGTSLELHFSGPSAPNITTPVLIDSVSASEVRFEWVHVSPPAGPALMRVETGITLMLAGASLLPNYESSAAVSPDAPVYIWRGGYMCIVRPVGT